jgi:hypothetical protein
MDEKFAELSEAFRDVSDLLDYQDRLVLARTVGALNVAVDRIGKEATEEERRAAWEKYATALTRLLVEAREVTEARPSERDRRVDALGQCILR